MNSESASETVGPISGKAEPREWKLRTELSVSDQELAQLRQETGLSPITLRVCLLRGLKTAKDIQEFLYPRFESLTNPMQIQDMAKAVDRLSQARAEKQKIRVFGDYDVDGTTGAALLSWILREFGFEHEMAMA
jgi:single-stranded-DNA-specific exonuclease